MYHMASFHRFKAKIMTNLFNINATLIIHGGVKNRLVSELRTHQVFVLHMNTIGDDRLEIEVKQGQIIGQPCRSNDV